jgi:branched-subunit amino acid ABC-type transport system permease component
VLRVNALALEIRDAREVGKKAGVVVVVAGTADQIFGCVVACLAAGFVQRADGPVSLPAAPVSVRGLETEYET